MVALCNKTYYCWGGKDKDGKDEDKLSSKGTQQARNVEILNKENYKSCLNSSIAINCQNSGFRFLDKAMQTYKQDKIGFKSCLCKGRGYE